MAQAIRRRPRRWPWVIAITLVVLLGVLSFLSYFYVDLLWFQEVGFTSVFWVTLWSKVLLGAVAAVVFFGLLYLNIQIARRLAPTTRAMTPDQQALMRYERLVKPYLPWAVPLVCVLLAVAVGVAAAGGWSIFLLWRNAGDAAFGMPDPLFHKDPAFYVFTLPFLQAVQSWLFSSLVGITVLVAGAHYLLGGIRPQARSERVTPQVKAHLSVLLGLIVLVQAWGYFLQRYDLLFSTRGVVDGASYTDVKAQLPALNILTIVAVVCAILFLVNIRLRGWAFPVIGVALLLLASVVIGTVIPAAVQQFSVEPQELQRERPYIEDNIRFTRTAFGLDKIVTEQADVLDDLPPDSIEQNQETINNIRLWDPSLLRRNYQQLQRIKPYYEFEDVDVDRYDLDGEKRVVMLSPREVSQNGIPAQGATWQNKHLVYTHGYGVVASLVNGATEQGSPLFIVRNIPPTGEPPELADELNAGRPQIYYGERDDVPFVVVKTGAEELEYQGSGSGDAQVTSTYEGDGGIPVGGFLRKALFALRFRDFNLLISDLIHPDSRIMIYRDIEERVQKAAPFLKYDGDPYSAIVDGRVVWIWDAYTTTTGFPYSESVDLGDLTGDALSGEANYIRNSVKVVTDAYTGKLTFYVADPEDPLIQVWARAFPDLFTDFDEAPLSLQEHFRYPENLMQVQATQFGNYHVTDPAVFYQKQDFWELPLDPTSPDQTDPTQRPYYVQTQLPGQEDEEFALILPLVPQGRQNMVAWMAARSDPGEDYGEVLNFEFPSGRNVDGPVQVFNQINAFPRFSAERTLLGETGSNVLFGNLLVVPVNNAFLYVQPVFVESAQVDAFPELRRVVVVHGGSIGIGTTLSEALIDSGLGGTVDEPSTEEPGQGESKQVTAILNEALRHFDAADRALREGDLATYQDEIEKARQLIQRAGALSVSQEGQGGGGSGSTTPSTPAPETSGVPVTPAPATPAAA